eukprot:1633486-Pleurochrysis_carterae.AAC.2
MSLWAALIAEGRPLPRDAIDNKRVRKRKAWVTLSHARVHHHTNRAVKKRTMHYVALCERRVHARDLHRACEELFRRPLVRIDRDVHDRSESVDVPARTRVRGSEPVHFVPFSARTEMIPDVDNSANANSAWHASATVAQRTRR